MPLPQSHPNPRSSSTDRSTPSLSARICRWMPANPKGATRIMKGAVCFLLARVENQASFGCAVRVDVAGAEGLELAFPHPGDGRP